MALLPNTVADDPGVGYAGQLAENDIPTIARSCRAESTGVHAGAPVMRGTDKARQVKVPSAALDVQSFAGIVLLETSRPFEQAPPNDGDSVTVLRFGSVYMPFTGAVTAGQRVRLKISDGTMDGVAAASDPSAGYCLLPCCVIAETTTGAGVACVEINLFGAFDVPFADLP